jgi:probable F420-dependent oxidoreductase
MTAIDIGRIGIWTGILDAHPASKAKEACQEIEALGVATLWIPETVGRDPFVAAANYLAATKTLRLATGIANIYARDALTMSSCQKTLAEAYPGRFLLGLGVSHHHLVERVRKHDYSKPLSYMQAYLSEMDAALYMAPKPADDGGRVLAALGPKMLATAATQANGAHPYFTTPEHTQLARQTMGADAFLAPEQMVVVESDPTKAREVARAAMHVYLRAPNYTNNLVRMGFDASDWTDPANPSDRVVDAIVAWGSLDQIRSRVQAHFDAGADHVCVQALRADRDVPMDDWRALAGALAQ